MENLSQCKLAIIMQKPSFIAHAAASVAPSSTADAEALKQQVVSDEAKYILQTYARPEELVISRGEGSYVYDLSGKKYLDFAAGIAVNALGPQPPAVGCCCAGPSKQAHAYLQSVSYCAPGVHTMLQDCMHRLHRCPSLHYARISEQYRLAYSACHYGILVWFSGLVRTEACPATMTLCRLNLLRSWLRTPSQTRCSSAIPEQRLSKPPSNSPASTHAYRLVQKPRTHQLQCPQRL